MSHNLATLNYGEISELLEILDGTELTEMELRGVLINTLRRVAALEKHVGEIHGRLSYAYKRIDKIESAGEQA